MSCLNRSAQNAPLERRAPQTRRRARSRPRRAGPADGRLLQVTHASRFDEIAPIYDETRGGEKAATYTADIDGLLPQDSGTVLKRDRSRDGRGGAGTTQAGANGRGRCSRPMLAIAGARLGPSVTLGDAQLLPVRTSGGSHPVGVGHP